MKVELVRIGNSRGIRIPKAIIEQCGFGDAADLRVEDGRLIIAPDRRPRQGWEEAFRAASSPEKDELLLDRADTRFDLEEWRW